MIKIMILIFDLVVRIDQDQRSRSWSWSLILHWSRSMLMIFDLFYFWSRSLAMILIFDLDQIFSDLLQLWFGLETRDATSFADDSRGWPERAPRVPPPRRGLRVQLVGGVRAAAVRRAAPVAPGAARARRQGDTEGRVAAEVVLGKVRRGAYNSSPLERIIKRTPFVYKC